MKKILDHGNKENINSQNTLSKMGHPSQESNPKPIKSTIKVGYKIIGCKQQQARRYKKPIITMKNDPIERVGVKKVKSSLHQYLSGNFVECQYIPKHVEKSQNRYHKKNVEEANEKYRSGREFSQQLRNQFIHKSRSSHSINTITQRSLQTQRNKLSGYKNSGIKDIIQYHHAGSYREDKIASKCSNSDLTSRRFKYSDINELDFRKNKPLLL